MDQYREIKNVLTWHNEGKFEAELVNGMITRLKFLEPGRGPEDTGKCLTSTSHKFLHAVYSCLGELFAFIEEENKKMGYRYAGEPEFQQLVQDEQTDDANNILQPEVTLKPLINYNHQRDITERRSDDEELRDIG
ncbi:MAG TPA: hypothetical protein VHS53_04850 [Mucilaginibacter sp.]|jgi:hypothetical protein|nr:hypothetical protein [Mucilaginibacter sp.]HWD87863.1 hypothetical protein [Mucilaginibacter sp.]